MLSSDTDNLTLTLSDFSGAKSIVFTGYDLTIVTKEQAEIDKKLEEQAKQEELAKQQEQDQLLAEVNDQTRFTNISDVRGTQVWSIYVEAGRSLRVYGNAGNNLSISIRDESGNLKNTDLVIGDFDQVYNLSSQYNVRYTVEIRYNPLNQNKWDFQVL